MSSLTSNRSVNKHLERMFSELFGVVRTQPMAENYECSFAGVPYTAFRLLIRMPYHWALGSQASKVG